MWHLISDPPEREKNVLCTLELNGKRYVEKCRFISKDVIAWLPNGDIVTQYVVAWTDLPKPCAVSAAVKEKNKSVSVKKKKAYDMLQLSPVYKGERF